MVEEAVTDCNHPGQGADPPRRPSEEHEDSPRGLVDSRKLADQSFPGDPCRSEAATDHELASSTLRTAEDQAREILVEAERQAAEMTATSETLMKEADLFRAEARQALDDALDQARVMRGRAEAAEAEARKTLQEARETNVQARSMYENAAELKKRAQADVGKRLSALEREAESIRTTALADAERMRAAAAAEARELANETRADVDTATEQANAEAQRVRDSAHLEAQAIIERAHQLALAVRRDALRDSTVSPDNDEFEGHADEQTTRRNMSTSDNPRVREVSEPVDEPAPEMGSRSRRRRRKERKAHSGQPSPIDLTDRAARPEAEPEAMGNGPAKRSRLRRR